MLLNPASLGGWWDVPETVVRGPIRSPIKRDFGSSSKYGISSKIDRGGHQLRSGNLAREKAVEDGGGE